jgi:two-component system LytT family response regulator
MTIDVLVVDDEPLSRLGVTTRLTKDSSIRVVGECGSAEEAIDLLATSRPDLIFLDIEMPGMSGVELVRSLGTDMSPRVIFLTAHDDYAIDAFELEVIDYLLKPINDVRFASCVERAKKILGLYRYASQQLKDELDDAASDVPARGFLQRFVVRRRNNITFVPVADIDWIEGLGEYAGLHVGETTHLIRKSLSWLVSHLDPIQFTRIHRSTILQVDRITHIRSLPNRDALVTLRDRTTLRASRSFRESLESHLRV